MLSPFVQQLKVHMQSSSKTVVKMPMYVTMLILDSYGLGFHTLVVYDHFYVDPTQHTVKAD